MSECTANVCYCGKNPPCWDHTERDFLREAERRAGASVEEMREWLTDKKSAKLGAAVFLRRILGEQEKRCLHGGSLQHGGEERS